MFRPGDGAMRGPAVAELLREREAKGLLVPAFPRMGFGRFGATSALEGIPSTQTVVLILSVAMTVIAVNAAFVCALLQRRFIALVGGPTR